MTTSTKEDETSHKEFRILFCTDFSEPSYYAMNYTAHLASLIRAELVLFHVYYKDSMTGFFDPFATNSHRLQHDAESLLKQYAQSITSNPDFSKMRKIKYFAEKGDFVGKALFYSERFDLMVVGGQGHGLADLFGNNAEKLMDRVTKPLLVIPHYEKIKQNAFQFKSIMYLSSFYHQQLDKEPIEAILQLLQLTQSSVKKMAFVHVSKHDQQRSRQAIVDRLHSNDGESSIDDPIKTTFQKAIEHAMLAYFKSNPLISPPNVNMGCHVLHHDKVIDAIQPFMKSHDLFIVKRHAYPFLKELFHKSVIHQLASSSSKPILIYS